MKLSNYVVLLTLWASFACSSPARIEVRPDPLILDGVGTKGQLEAFIFDEEGKQLNEGYAVTWMCLDTKTIKLYQDGTVIAQSSGRALVDVEIVGTEIHGLGNVEVKIPSWVETSHEELRLLKGQGNVRAWAEVRDDNGAQIKGYLPTWKVEDPKVLSIEAIKDTNQTRTLLKITALAPGETFLTASYKNFATDIRVTVFNPQPSPEQD
jgi:hypothetical protein